jgi:hypothetical protein
METCDSKIMANTLTMMRRYINLSKIIFDFKIAYFLERSMKIPINTPKVVTITTKATKKGVIIINIVSQR